MKMAGKLRGVGSMTRALGGIISDREDSVDMATHLRGRGGQRGSRGMQGLGYSAGCWWGAARLGHIGG